MAKVVANMQGFATEADAQAAINSASQSAGGNQGSYIERDAHGKPLRVHVNLPESADVSAAAAAVNTNPGVAVADGLPIRTTATEFNAYVDGQADGAYVKIIGNLDFDPWNNGASNPPIIIEGTGIGSGKGIRMTDNFGSPGRIDPITNLQWITDFRVKLKLKFLSPQEASAGFSFLYNYFGATWNSSLLGWQLSIPWLPQLTVHPGADPLATLDLECFVTPNLVQITIDGTKYEIPQNVPLYPKSPEGIFHLNFPESRALIDDLDVSVLAGY